MPADRIAIVKDGVLKASGSSVFLKKRFGLGYNLSLVIFPELQQRRHRIESSTRKSRTRLVTELLQDKIPEVELVRTTGPKLVFRVPHGCEDRLSITLATLDLHSKVLGIGSFGIENSSLEEVVLYLSESPSLGDKIPHDITTSISLCDESSCSTLLTGGVVVEPSPSTFLETGPKKKPGIKSLTWIEQVKLLYWKRVIIQKRDLKGLLFTVLVPTLVVALVLFILTVDVSLEGPAIEMSPSVFGIKMADVVLGGGAAFRYRLTAKRDIGRQVDSLQFGLGRHYQNVGLHHLAEIRSSWNMSDYLLKANGNYGGNSRFGSFVLKDALRLNVGVNWAFYESDLKLIVNNALRIFADISFDPAMVTEFIGLGVNVDFAVTVSTIENSRAHHPSFLVFADIVLPNCPSEFFVSSSATKGFEFASQYRLPISANPVSEISAKI